MATKPGPAKFTVEPTASREELNRLFERIAAYCRETPARAVLVRVQGRPQISTADLLAAVASLQQACAEGFKLAWVSADRETHELIGHTEYPTTRVGIQSRVFFDEVNAGRWLAW